MQCTPFKGFYETNEHGSIIYKRNDENVELIACAFSEETREDRFSHDNDKPHVDPIKDFGFDSSSPSIEMPYLLATEKEANDLFQQEMCLAGANTVAVVSET